MYLVCVYDQCICICTLLVYVHTNAHTQTHTRLFFAPAHRKDCNNKDRNHRSAMQAFLLLFGLLFRPGASVRLKTVGESWEGPTLDGPQAIIPVSQLYPALTQDENATWFTIHTVGTFACWAFPAGGGGPSQLSPTVFRRTLAPGRKRRPKSRRKACMAERWFLSLLSLLLQSLRCADAKKSLVCVCVCTCACVVRE